MHINFLKKSLTPHKTRKSFIKKEIESKPESVWKAALYLGVILVIGGFAFGGYVFTRVNRESTALPAESSGVETVKKERIEDALLYFAGKETKSAIIITQPAPIVDPSL